MGSFLVTLLTLMMTCFNRGCIGVPRIQTPLGDIQGVVEHIRNEDVYQFRNIPYAKPPIGHLRFAKPVAHGPWFNVLNATEFGPSCIQRPYQNGIFDKYTPNLELSEDCLSLNVYVPRDLSLNANRSVMVWIHGGGYIIGQGTSHDGSYLALSGDVVVVTINYRLGVFGFLATTNPDLPGNYGLWDQRLALEWVQANIRAFGGNPNSVTLFGQSAGGFCVSLHAITPRSKGLFHRVITQSGNPEGSFTIWEHAFSVSEELGKWLNCSSDNINVPSTYANCMRSIPASVIKNTVISLYNTIYTNSSTAKQILDIGAGPVVDGNLIPMKPAMLLSNKTSPSYEFFRSLDFMTGDVDTEGSVSIGSMGLLNDPLLYHGDLSVSEISRITREMYCNVWVPTLLRAYFSERINNSAASDLMCSLYGTTNWTDQIYNAMHSYADAYFIAPAVKSLQKHSEDNVFSSSFQYLFRRPMTDPLFHREYPPWWRNGSAHGSELGYLFGLEDYPTRYNISVTDADITLSKIMLKYWTNFAKTGNPNSDDVPRWDSYEVVRQNYINLDTTITRDQHLYGSRVDVWLNRLPKLLANLPTVVIGK